MHYDRVPQGFVGIGHSRSKQIDGQTVVFYSRKSTFDAPPWIYYIMITDQLS